MLIEIHTHTSEHSSCSKISAVDLVNAIHNVGVSGIVLTDHHYLWQDSDLEALRAKCNVPPEFLIMSGQEVFTGDYGDVLVYGADKSISQGTSLSTIRKQYPDAAIVWAHPYRSGLIPSEIELFNSDLDAIEIVNPHQKESENMRGISDWRAWGFVATSGSDVHKNDLTEFYPTCIDCEIKGVQGLSASIKKGLCSPRLGKYNWVNFQG